MTLTPTRFPVACRMAMAALTALLTACYADPFDATSPADVQIRLVVSGGLASASYSFIVDGEAGVVRGESCVRLCSFQPADILAPISEFQITEIARDLELAGVFGLDGSDFGVGCCDDFHYVLEYSDGVRTASLQGTGFRLPEPILVAITRIHNFHVNVMPAVVALSTRPADWPADPITVDSVRVTGYILDAFVTYGGGCRDHSIDLVAWNGWLESHPVRVGIVFAHNARGDLCRALIRSQRSFDLTPLRRAYQQAYGYAPATLLILLPRASQEDLVIPFVF